MALAEGVPTIVFASGKGGVGKSTVTLNVAVALARAGVRVGLVDADVYGPDIPAMLGITRRQEARSVTLWQADQPAAEPVERDGVKIMSPQFLVSEDQALDWSSPLVQLLLRRLVVDVAWGDVDVLLVDVPPGTGDLQQDIFGLLPGARAVVIVTPQYAAHLDARKLVSMLRRREISILGGVENMTGLACPSCGHRLHLFEEVPDEYSIWGQGLGRLAAIPFQPLDGVGTSRVPLVEAAPDSETASALVGLADRIKSILL
jgi:ATP-binding protein involved in chromosome partitioning